MANSSLSKAVIINLDRSGDQVECMFNPAEYTFTKHNTWLQGGSSGRDMPQIEFGSGQPASLQMQLFFDTYAERADVRERYTDKIWELMLVDQELSDPKSGKARPPMVRFQWGRSWSFDAVIATVTQRFSLFLDDGTPVRAALNVTFQQVRDTNQLRPQNPTSGGIGGQRLWTVKSGDTLPWIAFKTLGSPNKWRSIADANHLERFRTLEPGRVLLIPSE